MKILVSLVVAISVLTGFSNAHAMMSPDGSMMQLDRYDDAEKLVKAKDYDQAIETLKIILREFPAHANAWNLLGYSTRMTGDFDKANEYYNNALLITPGHQGALNYKGQMFVQTGRLDEAREMLAKLEVSCGMDCEPYQQLATAIKNGKAGAY